ncbi:DUF1484 family protein [Cupriavidus basilensis]|uniref:DUF1484 family protein n=1 Tax=Cupriavidus basilensis TaxID=68895 RepID=A0ABT6AM56_9BURK|nr:DUF1484 family protein [Cupriavidus basilensis]MDF3833693.1 DUF1484 family protein [Cupriavidus basilensis]
MDKHAGSSRPQAGLEQRYLIAELGPLIRADEPHAMVRAAEIVNQLEACGDHVRNTAMESCDELLRVSAGIGLMLTLLDQSSTASADDGGRHCILTLLKCQLDRAVDDLQRLF